MNLTTPTTLSNTVLAFCASIAAGSRPQYLKVDALPGAEPKNCFPLVQALVAERGGQSCIGWRIWEWPQVMIEAELHAVWRDIHGVLHDFSPAPDGVSRILFLPDPDRNYEGHQVNNVRRALLERPEVHAFIRSCDEDFEFMNRGERAGVHGAVELSGQALSEWRAIMRRRIDAEHALRQVIPGPGRNDPCWCRSGKKFKKCHGR